jgi:Na+/proline symporter
MLAVFAVGMFAAIISTVDSMLHTISSMVAVDIYKKSLNKDASLTQVAFAARIVTIVTVAIVMSIAFIQLPKFLSLLGFIAGAGSGLVTLSPLVIGLYWDRATKAGAVASSLAAIGSFAFFYWVVPVNVWERGCLAAAISVVTMLVVSLLTKPVSRETLSRMQGSGR